MKRMNLSLDDATHRNLKALAALRDVTVGELIKFFVGKEIEENPNECQLCLRYNKPNAETRKALEPLQSLGAEQMTTPWFRYLIEFDPASALREDMDPHAGKVNPQIRRNMTGETQSADSADWRTQITQISEVLKKEVSESAKSASSYLSNLRIVLPGLRAGA